MNTANEIISLLSQTPNSLNFLLQQIPAEKLDLRPNGNTWSAKEWLCHLVDAQDVLMDRFIQFEKEKNPQIKNYEPPTDNRYKNGDLNNAVKQYQSKRAEMIRKLSAKTDEFWELSAEHESYTPYSSKVLLIHCLNVDYAHLFQIEQIALGKH